MTLCAVCVQCQRGQRWLLYAIQDTLISKMMVVVMVTMLTTMVKTSTDGTQW